MKRFPRFNGLLVFLMVACACSRQTPDVRIVPEPARMSIEPKMVNFPPVRKVYLSSGDSALFSTAGYLCEKLNYSEISYSGDHPANCIFLEIKKLEFSNNPEAYNLVIDKEGVVITGNSARGIFYGIQTLLQLLPPEVYGESGLAKKIGLRIPQVTIEDEPRFPCREMQLDVGQHLFPDEFLRKYIDIMAMHKMNVLHLNPTEDQSHEVIAYAASRFVDVMPAIEIPGHSLTDILLSQETSGIIKAVRKGHDVILSPDSYCFFSYYQGDPKVEPKAVVGYLPIEKVYSYDPVSEGFTAEEAKHVLGAMGTMSTEYMADARLVEYMLVPRISALAEVLWTPKSLRDYEKFAYRMVRQFERFDRMQVNYRVPPPVTMVKSFAFTDSLILDLHQSMLGGEILYTMDGSDPLSSGKRYTRPLTIKETLMVKAITRMKSGHASLPLEIRTEREK
jgi:N-acetyl-beta-hexosaminidase